MARRDMRPGGTFPAIAFLVVLLFTGAALSAAEPPVSIDVGVVVASNEGARMDPALASIKAKLQSMFNYSSYRMLDRMKKPLAVGETGEFALPGNRSMRVTPAPASGPKVRLAVQVMEGHRNLLSTTLGLSRGGMVLVGGPSYQNGVMILIISAE